MLSPRLVRINRGVISLAR